MSEFFLHTFNTLGHGLIGYIVPFLFVLTIVVFFHELGHFLVARWAGVKVLTFSLGFGPELFGFNDRHGTRWKLSAIPLGGYVKFFGDDSEASTPSSEAVDKVEVGSAADAAGFKVGDVVTAIDGKTISSFVDMQRYVSVRAGEKLTFTVKRGNDSIQLQGTPQLREQKDPFGNVHKSG